MATRKIVIRQWYYSSESDYPIYWAIYNIEGLCVGEIYFKTSECFGWNLMYEDVDGHSENLIDAKRAIYSALAQNGYRIITESQGEKLRNIK